MGNRPSPVDLETTYTQDPGHARRAVEAPQTHNSRERKLSTEPPEVSSGSRSLSAWTGRPRRDGDSPRETGPSLLTGELPSNQIEHKLFRFLANQILSHFLKFMMSIVEYYLIC